MSNRVNIEPTKFENVRTGEVSLGVRVYDDEGCFYDNSWESIPDDDLEVLRIAYQQASTGVSELLAYVYESEKGLYIGGTWYEWDEIKSVFEQE